MRTVKTLIRLGGCPGWSESSLGAHSFCWFCHVAAHMVLCSFPPLIALRKWHLLQQCPLDICLATMWDATWQNQQCVCAPSEDSDQPGHPPSLIRVLAVRLKKPWGLSYPLSAQWRLWTDWADAQADLSFRWAHTHFVGFVMSRVMYVYWRTQESNGILLSYRLLL